MKFEETLSRSTYAPWAENYLDYRGLKLLLRDDDEDDAVDASKLWTDDDESRFSEELMNVQLEKVNAFQESTHQKLRERIDAAEKRLKGLNLEGGQAEGEDEGGGGASDRGGSVIGAISKQRTKQTLQGVQSELDGVSKEVSELERYSRINYSAALKIVKKHDKKRGAGYKLRPLLSLRLNSMPFNKEDYSPMLYRLSAMYSFVREQVGKDDQETESLAGSRLGRDKYTSHRFFVHPDNLIEVKTSIMRHLPVLVYNPSDNKIADVAQKDPTITSIYFDSPSFPLYAQKVDENDEASSLRLRWYGRLDDSPEVTMEKKTVHGGDQSEEKRFAIKQKYVMSFIRGEHKMEKQIEKLKDRKGEGDPEVVQLQDTVDEIQHFIKEQDLQPIIRANYQRTAFQFPGVDRVRINIDTNVAFIREDSLDAERPCRDPEEWHRPDIDNVGMEYPFPLIGTGEISRFPYALLDIKIRNGSGRKNSVWVDDLMLSHLVTEAPRFSKFIHGTAALFEEHVDTLPFWMSLLDTDVRRDPQKAFEEEQSKRAQRVEQDFAVGSYRNSPSGHLMPGRAQKSTQRSGGALGTSPSPIMLPDDRKLHGEQRDSRLDGENVVEEAGLDGDDGLLGQRRDGTHDPKPSRLRTLFPGLSTSKYARSRRHQADAKLPAGVRDPGVWIKDAGPVRVEPKVWLANQRTFIKWEHVCVLLVSLSLGLYNGAGSDNVVARALAVVYTLIALFVGGWGWWVYQVRSRMIEQRSGRDLDYVLGPAVVCVSLAIALSVNFGLKYYAVVSERERHIGNDTAAFTMISHEL